MTTWRLLSEVEIKALSRGELQLYLAWLKDYKAHLLKRKKVRDRAMLERRTKQEKQQIEELENMLSNY